MKAMVLPYECGAKQQQREESDIRDMPSVSWEMMVVILSLRRDPGIMALPRT